MFCLCCFVLCVHNMLAVFILCVCVVLSVHNTSISRQTPINGVEMATINLMLTISQINTNCNSTRPNCSEINQFFTSKVGRLCCLYPTAVIWPNDYHQFVAKPSQTGYLYPFICTFSCLLVA